MKKTILSLSLMALASASQAADLGLDSICNGNGYDGGLMSGVRRCDLPAIDNPSPLLNRIAVDDTIVLAKENGSGETIVWTLPGIVVVGDGEQEDADPDDVDNTKLVIEPGVQVAGAVNSNSALVISRGAQIEAIGSYEENGEVVIDPIIFSSIDSDMSGSGEWGGLVLSGFGESNNCPSGEYGGGSDDGCEMEGVAPGYHYGSGHLDEPVVMSSGTLSYVVIAEGGHEVAPASEINGLTLYAVSTGPSGDPTTINNIHVHNNADDGVEFFGGDVGITNMWMTCNEDDSVDWDEGYHGALFNLNIEQDDNAGYALELANNPNNFGAEPRADATIFNMSIDYVGTSTPANVPFKMKEGTSGTFNNVVVGAGYNAVDCDETQGAYNMGNHWNLIEYGCTPVNGDPANWNLPTSSAFATGFPDDSFWTAPACD